MDRRHFLKGTVATFAVGALAGKAAASGGTDQFTAVGVNKFDADGDGEIQVDASRQGGAPKDHGRGGGRPTHVHVGSDGSVTGDYLTTVVDVSDDGISLGDIEDGSSLTYWYMGGNANRMGAPDEVWLHLVEPDGTHHEVFRHAHDGNPDAQDWRQRKVHEGVLGESSLAPGFVWYDVTQSGLVTYGQSLVAEDASDENTPASAKFPSGTQITRIGAGRGTFGGDDVLDIYYDELQFNGEHIGVFPVRDGTK